METRLSSGYRSTRLPVATAASSGGESTDASAAAAAAFSAAAAATAAAQAAVAAAAAAASASAGSAQAASGGGGAASPAWAAPPGSLPVPAVAWSMAANGITSVKRSVESPRQAFRRWLQRFAQLVQFRLMMIFRLPTWGKMLALIMVGLPIILIGSYALRVTAGLSWHDAAQYAFYVLQNVPGMDITRFDQGQARMVLIAIHLLSLYTFATMVGLLTEDVRLTVEEIRSGNFPIPTCGHTVLLDSSGDPVHLLAVLRQVVAAKEARGGAVYPGCIAVLSTLPKCDVDKMVIDALPQAAATCVVTRHGSPVKVADLERVAAGQARTVLLLCPGRPLGQLSPGLQQELCLAALRSLHAQAALQGAKQPPIQPSSQPLNTAFDPPSDAEASMMGLDSDSDSDDPTANLAEALAIARAVGGSLELDGYIVSTSASTVMPTAISSSPTAGSSSTNGAAAAGAASAGASVAEDTAKRVQRLAQRSARGRDLSRRQRVVVESGSDVQSVATRVVDGDGELDPLQVTYVSSASSACRVAVQCAVQPGLAEVFDAIICRSDDSALHIKPLPVGLAGKRFGEARRQFRHAVLCGVVQGPASLAAEAAAAAAAAANPDDRTAATMASGSMCGLESEIHGSGGGGGFDVRHLWSGITGFNGYDGGGPSGGGGYHGHIAFSPPDSLVLRKGDELVLLAGRDADCGASLLRVQAPPLPRLLPRFAARRSQPARLVLLAHACRLPPAMLAALEEFVMPGCEVVVVSPQPCAGLPTGPTPRAALRLRNEVGDPLTPGALLRAGVLGADAVIITGTEEMPPDEADTLVTATALLLQRLLADPVAMEAAAAVLAAAAANASGAAAGVIDAAAARAAAAAAAAGAASAASMSASMELLMGEGADVWGNATNGNNGSVASMQSVDLGDLVVDANGSANNQWRSAESNGMPGSGFGSATSAAAARGGGGKRRRLPSRPLTFVCALRDPHYRTVLRHVAARACRAAVAAVAAAVGTVGGAVSGGAGGSAARGLSIEVVEPGTLVSGILAQVGADPRLVSGLEDLLDEQGCEVYIKRPDRYGLAPLSRLSWEQICEAVRLQGNDLAIGFIHKGHLHLAPPADTQLVLVAGDKLVVLSEHFV